MGYTATCRQILDLSAHKTVKERNQSLHKNVLMQSSFLTHHGMKCILLHKNSHYERYFRIRVLTACLFRSYKIGVIVLNMFTLKNNLVNRKVDIAVLTIAYI